MYTDKVCPETDYGETDKRKLHDNQGEEYPAGSFQQLACYKAAGLARTLYKMGANVQVIMTKNATQFISPLTFEQLTVRKCLTDTFDRNYEIKVEHVSGVLGGCSSRSSGERECAGQAGAWHCGRYAYDDNFGLQLSEAGSSSDEYAHV